MEKTKSLKIAKRILIALFLIIVLIAGILFFPLTGRKHTEIWSAKQVFDGSKIQTVEKTSQDFKILIFTDTQLWALLSDNAACYAQMERLVEKTNPDMIVLPGDNLSALASRFSIRSFIRHMDSFQVPWAPVFGNHDAEIPTNSKNWQADQYLKSEYCLFQKGPSNLYGCGNYVVNITENNVPVYTLVLLDNGEYTTNDDGSTREIWVGYEQIEWYKWNIQGIAEEVGRTVPSMVFSHFALPEFRTAIETYGVVNEQTGTFTIPEAYGFGECNYLPSVSPVNSGFFDACKDLGSTKYLFCGHDHENNASITYQGITMTYGLKTGPSPRPWNFAEQTGGTLITIQGSGAEQAVTIEHIVDSEAS